MADVQNVVLVHGGFVDGSGWRGVYDRLTAESRERERLLEQIENLQTRLTSLENEVKRLGGLVPPPVAS